MTTNVTARSMQGQTLRDFARIAGVDPQQLARLNGLSVDAVLTGQRLEVPPRPERKSSFSSSGGSGGPNLSGNSTVTPGGSGPVSNETGQPTEEILRQLEEGFRAAGRDDLADMVRTPEFQAWVNAESSWDPSNVSPANNEGKPNGGLFQVWFGHGVDMSQASPFEQAKFVAEKFPHLTPGKIQEYAAQIASGNYPGWG